MRLQACRVDVEAFPPSGFRNVFPRTVGSLVEILRLGRWRDFQVGQADLSLVSMTGSQALPSSPVTCCSKALRRGDADARMTRFALRCLRIGRSRGRTGRRTGPFGRGPAPWSAAVVAEYSGGGSRGVFESAMAIAWDVGETTIATMKGRSSATPYLRTRNVVRTHLWWGNCLLPRHTADWIRASTGWTQPRMQT